MRRVRVVLGEELVEAVLGGADAVVRDLDTQRAEAGSADEHEEGRDRELAAAEVPEASFDEVSAGKSGEVHDRHCSGMP
jgi:hypothetical protein